MLEAETKIMAEVMEPLKPRLSSLIHGIVRIVASIGLVTWLLISQGEGVTTIFLVNLFIIYASLGGTQIGSFLTEKEHGKETKY